MFRKVKPIIEVRDVFFVLREQKKKKKILLLRTRKRESPGCVEFINLFEFNSREEETPQ